MFRHHRQRTEQLCELISRVPWWAALLSALAAYALLHPIAVMRMPTPEGAVSLATNALGQLLVMLAQVGQFLIPLGLLLVTAVSAYSRWKRWDLRYSVTSDAGGTLLRGLPGSDFELLVAEAFRGLGYRVAPAGDRLPVRAAELELTKGGQYYLLHYGRWKASKLDAEIVRELQAAIADSGADGGFVVTSGQYTPEARRFADAHGIELIDGGRFRELIGPDGGSLRRESFFGREAIASALRRLKGATDKAVDRTSAFASSRLPSHRATHGVAPERSQRSAPEPTGPDQEAMEVEIGRELAALVRSEDEVSVPPYAAPPLARPTTRTQSEGRGRRGFKLRLSRIADLAGILLTSAGIWAGYQWFQNLPERPAKSPWALLGTGGTHAIPGQVPGRSESGATANGSAQSARDERPLGQFNFGGSWEETTSAADRPVPVPEEEPFVEYHSIRELETAFNAKYVPPPECYQWETTAEMARCGNHRMRARRAFIESGGRITPEMLGTTGIRGGYPPPEVRDPTSDWREQAQGNTEQPYAPTWQQPAEREGIWAYTPGSEWEEDGTQPQDADRYGDRQQYLPAAPGQDRRQEQDWGRRRGWAEEQDWQQSPVPDGSWQQTPDWRAQEYTDRPAGWLREQDGYESTTPDGGAGWREDRQ